jgi:hypothetical protein
MLRSEVMTVYCQDGKNRTSLDDKCSYFQVDQSPSMPVPCVHNVSEESVDIYSGMLPTQFLTPNRRRKSAEVCVELEYLFAGHNMHKFVFPGAGKLINLGNRSNKVI